MILLPNINRNPNNRPGQFNTCCYAMNSYHHGLGALDQKDTCYSIMLLPNLNHNPNLRSEHTHAILLRHYVIPSWPRGPGSTTNRDESWVVRSVKQDSEDMMICSNEVVARCEYVFRAEVWLSRNDWGDRVLKYQWLVDPGPRDHNGME